MPPSESPRSKPLPEPLLRELRDAAKANKNYEPTALTTSVRKDIERALIYPDSGQEREERERERNIAVLCEAIRAQASQIRRTDGTNLLWQNRSAGSSPEEFRASPRTTTKSVQEALTHPADRVAVTREMLGIFTRGGAVNLDSFSIEHIIIDPRRLSNRLLINLGLEQHVAPKGSPEIDQINYKKDAIPDIKEILGSLEPISLPAAGKQKCYRLFLITEGVKAGYILGVQEIAGDERMFVTTLHGARRRVDHIEDGYVQELAQLARIKNTLAEVDLSLEQDWPTLKLPVRMRMLLATLHGLVDELEFVIDEDKRTLYDAIERAADLIKVKNKGAARACINRMRTHKLIGGRQQEIPRIFGELAKDKLMIQGVIEHEASSLEVIYEKVKEQKGEPRLLKPGTPLSEVELEALRKKLNQLTENLQPEHIKFQPHRTFADALMHYLRQTREHLDPQNLKRNEASEAFIRAFVVSKLAHFNHFLLTMYEAFSVHGKHGLSVSDWRNELETAAVELNERTVGRKIYTQEFNQLWINLRALIADIKQIMDRFAKTRGKEKRKEVIEKMKQTILDFDLPSRISAMQKDAELEPTLVE